MTPQHILITGGTGFVGSNLAMMFKAHNPKLHITAFDNLKRRGGELNIPRFQEAGIQFVHGDIRNPEDLDSLPVFDLLIDCSAEPSVQAGLDGSPLPVIHSNLTGTIHLMDLARRHDAAFLFLSTSRVYPIDQLNAIPWTEDETRFRWTPEPGTPGISEVGITEQFSLEGARSIYGATKLASELLLQEYAYSYNMPVMINRCGILTGPWQMGKVDQGVITLWLVRHYFGLPLKYIGFGGTGKQVRDMLHVDDLFQLILKQLAQPEAWDASIYNVGGGLNVSTSLLELTGACQRLTGKEIPITPVPETSAVDLRLYLTDCSKAEQKFNWRPKKSVDDILSDIKDWISTHEELLRPFMT